MTVCPFAAWRPVQNHGGPVSAHLGLVLHVQQGNNSLAGWFNNPSSDASSTFWVAKDGTLEQYVDADLCAWAQGDGNSTYASVETEGYDTEPLTSQQEATLADLYAWGFDTYGWPNTTAEAPGQPGFGWHGMGGSSWGGHTGCPGDLRQPRRGPILAIAFGGGSTDSGDDDMPLNDDDKAWIIKAINDALRQQFAPSGECYGRVRGATNDSIQGNEGNYTRWAEAGAAEALK
jgi:hypothetical protein